MLITSSLLGYFTINKPFSKEDEELFKKYDYGTKINVNGRKMNVGIFGENNSTTIVYLPGLFQSAPYFSIKPVAEALADKYRFIVIEPFGYGLSDIVDEERTIENICLEIHSAIKELKLEKYYLMAHSLYGLYCVHLANRYPEEVLGFIGIDATVPGQEPINKMIFNLTQTKLVTLLILQIKGLSMLGIRPTGLLAHDMSYNFTEDEIEAIKINSFKRTCNKTVYHDAIAVEDNLRQSQGMKFPESVPVLNLIAMDKGKKNQIWEQLHRDVITENKRSKVVILEGNHMLHLCNRKGVLKEIREWLN